MTELNDTQVIEDLDTNSELDNKDNSELKSDAESKANEQARKTIDNAQAKLNASKDPEALLEEIKSNPAKSWQAKFLELPKKEDDDFETKYLAMKQKEKAEEAVKTLSTLPESIRKQVEAYKEDLIELGANPLKVMIRAKDKAEELLKQHEESVRNKRSNASVPKVQTFPSDKSVFSLQDQSQLSATEFKALAEKHRKGEITLEGYGG